MYKAFLSLRYLKTRYIALASILSVMLGVATMIVVNSVMKGFTAEMRSRIQGLLSDIVVETNSLDGAQNADAMFRQIRNVAGQKIEGMTATVEVWGLITFPFAGQFTTRPITLIGIEPEGKSKVGPFKQYLESFHPKMDGKKMVRPALRAAKEPPGWELTSEALAWRKEIKQREKFVNDMTKESELPPELRDLKTASPPAAQPGSTSAPHTPVAATTASKKAPAPLPANPGEKSSRPPRRRNQNSTRIPPAPSRRYCSRPARTPKYRPNRSTTRLRWMPA